MEEKKKWPVHDPELMNWPPTLADRVLDIILLAMFVCAIGMLVKCFVDAWGL